MAAFILHDKNGPAPVKSVNCQAERRIKGGWVFCTVHFKKPVGGYRTLSADFKWINGGLQYRTASLQLTDPVK